MRSPWTDGRADESERSSGTFSARTDVRADLQDAIGSHCPRVELVGHEDQLDVLVGVEKTAEAVGVETRRGHGRTS